MRTLEYSTVIIGSGIAGLYSALEISKRSDFKGKVLIVTKCPFGESNSRYAQGGIAGVIKSNTTDSVKMHIEDTLKSGAGLCDKDTVEYIVSNAEKTINKLASIGAGFDSDLAGNYVYTLGGGHSAKRVLHSGEDATGMVMIKALTNQIKQAGNIDIMQKTMAVELLVFGNKCYGAVLFEKDTKKYTVVYSDNVILASGGMGQLYKYTTNPYGATGDGYVLAYSAGATLQDIEFIQFHPTALVLKNDSKNRYLISEALRGEGARLINNSGEEFMHLYSDKKELAPRDIVTRAIISEMQKENKPNVFLSTNNIDVNILLKRFPSITKKCKVCGIDVTKEPIPVAPAAHYMIGGVRADVNGKTSINGLYAIGEIASTGFHGANRLASNSLLECVVCADKLASEILLSLKSNKSISNDISIENIIKKYQDSYDIEDYNYQVLKNELREIMWENAGIIKSEKSLLFARNKINELKNKIANKKLFSDFSGYEYKNMLILASLIIEKSLLRKESRGAHYRSDYSQTNSQAEHSYCSLINGVVCI